VAVPSALRVDGKRKLEITETGRAALDAGVITDVMACRLAEELAAAEEPIRAAHLRKRIRGLTYLLMTRCEKAGWLLSHYEAKVGKGVKTELFVRLVRDPYSDERIGTKQEAIILAVQAVEEGEWVALSALRDAVDNPRPSLKSLQSRGIIETETREVYRDPFAGEAIAEAVEFELTVDQAAAVGEIRAALDARKYQTFLLHGVTGSGKTEVYIRAIREVIKRGDHALVLLPEISLTPQFVAIFRGHFGTSIAVLHSGLSDGERFDEWRRIHRGEVSIVIGARSALFAPLQRIGIIIVDEEHDTSFKQESMPRYNARDLSQLRGRMHGAVVVLGSATPSVETYQKAREEKIGYLPMSTRVKERQLPEVQIVDLREQGQRLEEEDFPDAKVLSRPLATAIQRTLDAGEQTILFLNRRGHSPYVHCRSCGKAWECPNCSVTLTYHKTSRRVACHYCDHSEPVPELCKECGSHNVGLLGMGTQKLEGVLEKLYPTARVARLDRDTGKGLRGLMRSFRRREIDILVGTQMVTKGHDFPHVTLVGVILADQSLKFPDFRAGERTFQLLTQVAGRAGRGESAGRVIIQTYSPEHYSLLAAKKHSYAEFTAQELRARRELGYPPFGWLTSILFESADAHATERAARLYADHSRKIFGAHSMLRSTVAVLGPAQAPLARLRGKSRWQILLKGRTRADLRAFTAHLLASTDFGGARPLVSGVSVSIDVDPQSML